MKKHLLTAACLAAAFIGAYAADNDPVLMTVDGNDIRVSEFEYLFNKNNTQQAQPQTLDQYLDMFVNYKLKVADAVHAGLDTVAAFRTEFQGYKRELAAPYMKDAAVEEELVQQAYERRHNDVKVSHIMFNFDERGRALADSVLTEIRAGRLPFEEAAATYSIDRGSSHQGGLMGYVTPDRFPYAFEYAAYNTPVGQVSDVVNSGMGFHIIRVEESTPTRGEVLCEHILLLTRGVDPEEVGAVKARIDSLYAVAVADGGASFKDLATRFSQDPGSARNGGELPWFGSGKMVAEFDSAAFATPVGTVSKPFQTRFGYHIIHKVDQRGLAPLSELRPQIVAAMANDERASMPMNAVVDRVKAEKHAKIDQKGLKKARKIIERNGGYDSVAIAALAAENFVVATYDGGAVRVNEVMPRMPRTVATDVDNAIANLGGTAETVVRQRVLDLYRDELAQTNPDYRNLLNEYRDGILLYEISTRNVWDKAARDTVGLEEYFHAHIDRYQWDQPRFKSTIIFASSDSVLAEALEYAPTVNAATPQAFVTAMRERFGNDVKVERVIAAQGENPITDYLAFGGDKPAADARSRWTAYAAYNGRIIDAPEVAADVRGAAVTDYQAELDRQWVEQLRRKYPVVINTEVFEALKAFNHQ